ncbi:glutamate receptor 2.7-like [Pistacia vera]|uniref:glutamate receptor 2.7-like n=1 Tax=Pistacia vera TaxID=55513 RepID=UPI001262E1AA|nr:glutamate receptor 2.7-like [Pistacia vera]
MASLMKMKDYLFLLSFILVMRCVSCEQYSASNHTVKVGVILDLNSSVGRTAYCFIRAASSDFYAKHADYRTRLYFLFRDSRNDVVAAASAALDLMKNEQVHAIIGPQSSSQAQFVIELGTKANVPIISFSATSPFLSLSDQTDFFIRTTHDDSFQVKAIADIVIAYGWRAVIPIYEDTDFGNGLIPYLINAFQEANILMPNRSSISPHSNGSQILKELQMLKTMQTKIFLVHMTASLGSKLFVQAKKAGMMKEGYAWIVTEGLSTLFDPVVSKSMHSMEGVLGLRTQLPNSMKKFKHSKSKWMKLYKPNGSISIENVFGMWGYDTVWAIAMAVEKAGTAHSIYLKPNTSEIRVDIAGLGRFEMGQKLLNTLQNTRFEGLSGTFGLVEGQLKPSVFEIFNVVGEHERIIGYWSQKKGLHRDLESKEVKSTSMDVLKPPIWPGDTTNVPKNLRIGVPVKEGFTEFVKVEWQSNNNMTTLSGFSIEVFKEVLAVLEFALSYEFVPFHKNHKSAGSYDELIYKIKEKEFDAVVGDTTIVANRSKDVDFTMPYSESGVRMVVLVKDNEKKNFWIFLKPLSWKLWLTTGLGLIFTGFVVWVLEHRINTEFRGSKQDQLGTIFWFSFSTLNLKISLDLMKNEQVHAIIGPQSSSQAKFVIELGTKANVPIISFSATSPFLSLSDQTDFFIRTTHDDSFQVKAIADIVIAYGWRAVIPIYEDTDFGNGLIPYLINAFQEANILMPNRSSISPHSNGSQILKELQMLKTMQTKIFLVHMTASLGSKLFVQAKKAGMMKEGYAWIVTEGLSTLFDPVVSKSMHSMEGVLGLRTQLPNSMKKFKHSKSKWMKLYKPNGSISIENVFGMWGYDTVWAIAMAVEKAGTAHSIYLKPNTSEIRVDIAGLGRFEMGQKLLNTLQNTRFEGLSGTFGLVEGQLKPSVFEIFNVVGEHERIIGYWSQKKGLHRDLESKEVKSTSMDVLKPPIWPGDTTNVPKNLRIGVPVKEGFTEFVKVEWQSNNNMTTLSGFSIEVFKEVLAVLEFALSYEFVPFHKNHKSAGSYDELIYKIKEKEFDAVVGDTTIVANRSKDVDFTMPYSESGVRMVVLVKDNEKKNFWIFLKPLSWKLWLTTGLGLIFTGFVVWVLEHRINTEFRGSKQDQLGTIFWFSFSTLVFAHRERVLNNWSRFVLIIWVFVVLILTQSYTANLTSMLTVQRLQPSFANVEEIRKLGYSVGYQNDSFVKDLLAKQLKFNESNLWSYRTPEEFDKALSSGTVAAIFDEIPYINVFLAQYCSRYMMIGPTYETDGFGFAFPLGSPLVSNISRAILNVTQDKDKMEAIEKKTLGTIANCEGHGDTAKIPSSTTDLSVHSFGGPFIITGAASIFSVFIYIFYVVSSHWPEDSNRSFWSKVNYLKKLFDTKDDNPTFQNLQRSESRVHPVAIPEGNDASPDHDTDDMQNHPRMGSDSGEEDVEAGNEHDDEVHSSVDSDTPMFVPQFPS